MAPTLYTLSCPSFNAAFEGSDIGALGKTAFGKFPVEKHFKFFSFRQFFLLYIFQPHIRLIKTCFGNTALDEGLLNTLQNKVYILLCKFVKHGFIRWKFDELFIKKNCKIIIAWVIGNFVTYVNLIEVDVRSFHAHCIPGCRRFLILPESFPELQQVPADHCVHYYDQNQRYDQCHQAVYYVDDPHDLPAFL